LHYITRVAKGYTKMCIASKITKSYVTPRGRNCKTYRKVGPTTQWRET